MADHNQQPIQVQPPGVRPRSRGLLTDVAVDLSALEPTVVGNYDAATAVLGGVVFCSDACGNLTPVENAWCDDVPQPEDFYEASMSGPFDSFWVQADDLSPVRYDSALTRARLAARFDARISAALAHELLTGDVTGNPSLSSAANNVVAAATTVDESLFVMDEILATYDGIEFTIHSSPGLFELLVAAYDITQDDAAVAGDPNRRAFRLATGHKIVGDAGHVGSIGPEGVAAGDGWLYATTDVVYWTSGPQFLGGGESGTFDRARNTRDTVYGAQVLVGFDECAVVAVNVNVPEYSAVASGDV